VPAKDLANPPPALATESSGEARTTSRASAAEARGTEPAGTLQEPQAVTPTSAMASVEGASPQVPPETRIVTTSGRPAAKRYAAQSVSKTSAHRHVAKKSRRYEAPGDGYAYEYSGYSRYHFAGERPYGGYWGAPSGYGQRGGWFSGVN
jgi:hypothetical protein